MLDLEPRTVADILLAAPAWAQLGLTMPDQRLRERAAEELACVIVERVGHPLPIVDVDQFALPL